MTTETDKGKLTPPAPAKAVAPKAQPTAAKKPQASPKPSTPSQQQAGSPASAKPKPAAPAFERRRVWPD